MIIPSTFFVFMLYKICLLYTSCLQQMPANQRKDFLVRAILAEEQRDAFKQILREVIREELARGVVIQEPTKPTEEKEVPKQTLDFLASLCD